MFSGQEQLAEMAKTNLNAQIAAMTAFAQKAFASAEKIVELNMTMTKQSIADNTAAAQQLVHAKGPQEFFAMSTASLRPNADKAAAYGRQLASITTAARSDFTREAESQMTEARRKFSEMIETASRNAPAGTESVVAMMKTAMGNATAGFDQFNNSAKQATDTIERNVSNTVSKISEAAEKATSQASKK
ncbi:MAG: phasin family protein [Pseudomonadota bacterium]